MNNPQISIIAALSENKVIGKNNKIPWHIKEDLVRLKNLTIGHVVIIGKNSYESMLAYYAKSGKPTMSQRTHVVVTSDQNYRVDPDKGVVVHSIEEALGKSMKYEVLSIKNKDIQNTENEIFIIGGARIFNQTINLADRLYLTIVKGSFDGDTFFPDYSAFTKVIEKEEHEDGGYKYTFFTLEK